MVAKREEEMEEIGSKSPKDINKEIIDLKGELFMIRLQKPACSEFKSSEFSLMRKRAYVAPSYLEERCCRIFGRIYAYELCGLWRGGCVPCPWPATVAPLAAIPAAGCYRVSQMYWACQMDNNTGL
ncbi:hypothetical protein ACLOJK_006742 [Asimina triloba]